MDDDLLALERGVEIWDDADGPGPVLGQDERLRGRPILAARAERARLQLVGGRVVDHLQERPGPARAAGCDYDRPARERIAQNRVAQPCFPRSSSGPISSSGNGRISVEVRSELISSIVCR